MEPPTQNATAPQACGACKKHKRKCDKLLPQCSLCVRTCRTCDYHDAPRPPPTAAEVAALQARLAELEHQVRSISVPPESVSATLSVSGDSTLPAESIATTGSSQGPAGFPAALFLDFDCYQWSNMQLPRPDVGIPTEVLGILSQENTVLETLTIYSGTIHRWLPIISKRRMELGISLQNNGPDLAMLFLAMRLNISLPTAGTNSLYSISRSFLATLEAGGLVSLVYLQAMILVAVYEYSHAIYPAAWMTVGACARLAELLGLSSGRESMKVVGRATTWTEVEEKRRVWWAIYILDRVISLGSRRRFSFPEPLDGHVLPASDEAWDLGDVTNIIQYSNTTHFSTQTSPFARLCQSAMFISRAATFRNSSQTAPLNHMVALTSLTEELCTYSSILTDEIISSPLDSYFRLLAPRCLTWSALFILLDNYCCPEKLTDQPGFTPSGEAKGPEELATQLQATLVVRSISDQAHEQTKTLMDILFGPASSMHTMNTIGSLSPLSLDALYCSMVTFQWIYREGGEELAKSQLEDMEAWMRRMSERWRLASEYLTLSEIYRTAETS